MGRRSPFAGHWCKPVSQLILLSAALGLGLIPLAVDAQNMPPAPPPDVQAAPSSGSTPTDSASTQEPAAPAQSSVRAVRLSDVEGQVQVFQGDQIAFNQAEPNMPAVEGMRFVTGDNGRLEIEFEDGSVARVAPDSSIRLTQLRRNADGSTVTQIDALSGLSYYELNGHGGQYSVHCGTDAATPADSAVFRVALDSVPIQIADMHGTVHIDDGQGVSLDIHPSQTFQTDPQQSGEYTVEQNIAANSWDQWNSDRDQALAQMESSETTARASSGNPNDPGWNDLDYYGNWYNLPGYGQVWAPAGVGAGWDPFGNGYWGYYPSFGYTWISGYPWGWWPYHCGAWDYADGWGWLWVPGNCGFGFYGAGWYPYATVWQVPRGYVPPPRPTRIPSPRHGPGNGPGPKPQPLIAVDRGPQFAAPFRLDSGNRPAPRPLNLDGQTITPIDSNMRPLQRGPLGESFTATMVRVHPEVTSPAMRGAAISGFHGSYVPPTGMRTFGAPPNFSTGRPAILLQPGRGFSPGAAGTHPNFGGGAHVGGAPAGGAAHATGGGGGVAHH